MGAVIFTFLSKADLQRGLLNKRCQLTPSHKRVIAKEIKKLRNLNDSWNVQFIQRGGQE